MMRSMILKLFVLFSCLTSPVLALAQSAKPLLDTKIIFAKDGSAKLSYDSHGATLEDTEGNKIETWLVFYAFVMNRLDADSGKILLNQVQDAVGKVATDQGMIRADIIKDNPILKPLQTASIEQNIQLAFSALPSKGHSLEVKPDTIDNKLLAPAVIYLLQDEIKSLSESGVRLMVLSMGGMNKWYREVGKASDTDSVAKAPAYALNLAVDILEKLSAKKKTQ